MLNRYRKDDRTVPAFTEDDVREVIRYLSFIRFIGEPGNVRTGRKLLNQKGCKSCHRFGREGGDVGPDLSTVETYLSPLSFATAMWNHGPEMQEAVTRENAKYPTFRDEEVIDVAAAVRASMAPISTPPDAVGSPDEGLKLVSSKNCDRCHAVRGSGGDSAPDFAEMSINASVTEIAGRMWNHGPDMWAEMVDLNIPFPYLESEEMADLLAFVYQLALEDDPGDVARGRELVVSKGCDSCHGEDASVSTDAIPFSEMSQLDTHFSLIMLMWNHVEDMDREVRERKMDWPDFAGSELADILAFLENSTSSSINR
jgi:cytochrome c2